MKWLTSGACALGLFVCMATPSAVSGEFASIVDDYLDAFARRHPSIAAGNGLHMHDDRLEDFSAGAIAEELADLARLRARVEGIHATSLDADERVDQRILLGVIDGWYLDLETVQTWRRNPMIYASAITDGVHNLMTMESSPADARMRTITSKLEHVPSLLETARTNLNGSPDLFIRRGAMMFHGAAGMLIEDLPLAFASADSALRAKMMEAATRASQAVEAYARELDARPPSTAPFTVGRANLEARYRAEELIDLPADRLLAIGQRELDRTQAQFRETAGKISPGVDPVDVWHKVQRNHPGRGELVAAAQKTVDELLAFGQSRQLLNLPSNEPVTVAAAPVFDLGLASMHSSPPLEATPVKSFYYVTDAQPDWPADRQEAWLQKFNFAALAVISAHEVYPGHYAHSLFMRQTPGKIRRIWIGLNPFPQPSSGQDGWAHYAEQMILDEGFHQDDPRYRLAQLSEALTRICRLIDGIKLHTSEWTIDQGAAFFEREAHLPAPAARQEAERGAYDPTYGGYFLGKLAALNLRRDYAAAQRSAFNLRAFHERVMRNGIAPWWAHRQLLLPGDTRPAVD